MNAKPEQPEVPSQMPAALDKKIDLAERKAMGFRVLQRVLESAKLTYDEAEAVNLVLGQP